MPVCIVADDERDALRRGPPAAPARATAPAPTRFAEPASQVLPRGSGTARFTPGSIGWFTTVALCSYVAIVPPIVPLRLRFMTSISTRPSPASDQGSSALPNIVPEAAPGSAVRMPTPATLDGTSRSPGSTAPRFARDPHVDHSGHRHGEVVALVRARADHHAGD